MKMLTLALALVLFATPAHAQSRVEPTGAVFCTVVAMIAAGIAAVMYSPVMEPNDGDHVVGASMIVLAGTSLGLAINLTIPRRRESAVRVAANGLTIHW